MGKIYLSSEVQIEPTAETLWGSIAGIWQGKTRGFGEELLTGYTQKLRWLLLYIPLNLLPLLAPADILR